ncbi:serine hydrolase [Actinomadura madurae]|uniref:serine hydrolase n=1 Tax=Actinomadura madurae TaxID=1993 RepID=UPI000DD04CE5|nr:serine hydrolase [Actinomadura madurae]
MGRRGAALAPDHAQVPWRRRRRRWRGHGGQLLLGAIVAAVSDHSYYDYIAERVFKTADMHDSAFHTKPEWRTDPRIAHPYFKKKGHTEWTDGLEEHAYIGLPAANSFATCADLERFARVLLENKLMEAPYTQLMLGIEASTQWSGDQVGRRCAGTEPARLHRIRLARHSRPRPMDTRTRRWEQHRTVRQHRHLPGQ